MRKLKGELDLYKYRYNDDGSCELVKHHHQFNYDTIRGRLDPNFSDSCYRITKFECDKSHSYPVPVQYDNLTILPIYFDEPLFIPNTIDAQVSDDGFFALSYDQGSTWWVYNSTELVEITEPGSAANLRTNGMTKSALYNIPFSQHSDKYVDHVVIMATPNTEKEVIYGYKSNLKYDSSLIDPYYVRWMGDIPKINRYTLETLPISNEKNGNEYSINVSNLSGVAPIELDSLLTFVGEYIGTFTYVGLSVEINEVLVGTYTIYVEEDLDIDEQRSKNAKMLFWGTETPSNDDGVLGGVRYQGAETQGQIYTYNGGPSQNVWMWPFIPDNNFRELSLKRSIGLPWSTEYEYGDNVIDPSYGLLSTGSVKLWSTDNDFKTGLAMSPILYRYRFLTSGDANTSEYLLFYKNRTETFMGLDRVRPDVWTYQDSYMEPDHGNGWQLGHNHLLKNPQQPIIWNKLLYDYLQPDGVILPKTSSNPYHDLIIEVYDNYLTIARYGMDIMLRIDANSNEIFYSATASLEEHSGHDLVIYYYDTNQGNYFIASIPITISRNNTNRSLSITINGDLTERYFVGNVSSIGSPSSTPSVGLYDMLRVQQAKSGPWSPSILLNELKTKSGSFLTALHEDSSDPTDDSTYIFDQEWDLRHLKKLGSVNVASDIYGDQAATFDSTSLIYLVDDNGDSGRNFRWDMIHPTLSTYLEFQPSILQDSTLLQNRGGKALLSSDGTFTIDSKYPLSSAVTRTELEYRQDNFNCSINNIYNCRYCLAFINPDSEDITNLSFNLSNGLFEVELWSPEYSDLIEYDEITYANGSWQGIYWDSTSSTVKVNRIHSDNTGLFISSYDVNNRTYSTTDEYTVGGLPFTHAINAASTMYTNDSNEPILIIYAGENWEQTDGLLEINLKTKTLNQIPITGTQIGNIEYGEYNDGNDKAITYLDSNGDRITVAVKNPVIGQCFYYNHTTGICTEETIGEFIVEAKFLELWGALDRYETRPWNIHNIRGTSKAIFITTSYSRDSLYNNIEFSLIDFDKKDVLNKSILTTGIDSDPLSPTLYYSVVSSCPIAQYPHGHEKSNDHIDELVFCPVITGSSCNTTYSYVKHHRSYVNVKSVFNADEKVDSTYTTGLNKFGLIEFDGFQIGVLNDQIMITGPNKSFEYDLNISNPRLSNMVIGGNLEYDSSDTSIISNYTSSSLFDGTVKNIVNRTQSPRYGAYRFPCYMYNNQLVDSFFTKFTGTTTFLICISGKENTGTYFLDVNNSYQLTLITDANLTTVTPNEISEINYNLSSIKSSLSNNDKIGLIYYNIDGDTGTESVSKTYVKYICEANDPVEDLTKVRRTSDPKSIYKNGNFFNIQYPADTLYNHLNEIVHINYDDDIYMNGYFNLAQLQGFVGGFAIYTNSYSSTPTGGCSFISIDENDNFIAQSLSYDRFSDTDTSFRHYVMSDIYKETIEFSIWNRQHSDISDGETMVFYKSGEPDSLCMYIPMNTITYDNGDTEQLCMLPYKFNSKSFSIALPYPGEAPIKFKETANAAGYKEWGDLRWYFQDGTGTSFVNDEVISFSLGNEIGYSIDNWQVINSFNSLIKGELDSITEYGKNSASADGSTISVFDKIGIIDMNSTIINEPTEEDKFFILFEDENDK